ALPHMRARRSSCLSDRSVRHSIGLAPGRAERASWRAMEDASHLLQDRRFFGLLFSVLPGLELMYGLTFLVIWLFADVLQVPWGWGVGLGGLTFALTLVIWLFVGMGIQKWTEDKSGKFLF